MKKILLFAFLLIFTRISFSQHIGNHSGHFSIVVNTNGTIYTWGSNSDGQLGNGNNTYSNIPVAVTTSGVLSGKSITRVAGGRYFSIALASDGTVFTWGNNGSGQLGNGNTGTNSNVPVAVSTSGVLSGKAITQIAAGVNFSMALASDGTVYTWGQNLYKQLGNGSNIDSNIPVAVTTSGALNGKTITQVAAGIFHSIALASDGTVYTWGNNGNGQLGNGNNTESNVPVAVSTTGVLSGKTITQIGAGEHFSIALASDGTLYSWGYNNYGQLGNGNTGTNSNVPVAVTTSGVLNGKTIIKVAGGKEYSIALASDGTVYSWGYNNNGQLGNGISGTNSNVPVAVSTSGVLTGKSISQVAGGFHHTIALASDGTIYTWGRNSDGQLGNFSNTNSNVPVAVDLSSIGGTLPVELKNFTARTQNNNVILNWKTITETNNSGFEVERSTRYHTQASVLRNWEKVSFVRGSGTSNVEKNYNYTDNNLRTGKYSYRLKQIDLDGTTEYSQVKEVEVGSKKSKLTTNPNPFNSTTIINYEIEEKTEVTIKLYDLLGRVVAEIVNNELKEVGEHEVKFNANHLTSGVYLLKFQTNKNSLVEKLVLMK